MRKVRWARLMVVAALGSLGVQRVAAEVISDQAAAILKYPLIVVGDKGGEVRDTFVQLSNTSADTPANAHCFYENANSHCTNTGEVCIAASDCCESGLCGICVPGWNEVDFRIRLTPRQPIGWLAGEGLFDFPIDGRVRTGIGGMSNAGSRIPPVPEQPFLGLLKCIVVDDNGTPIDSNVLTGNATIEQTDEEGILAAKYNAVGIQAVSGAVNDDNILVLGGPEPEYNGCPAVIILNHFFDFAADEEFPGFRIFTYLTLAPCTQDLLRQVPGSAVVQYLVYNEFEQRFSTSRSVDCLQSIALSSIDTTQPERSIFSAGVAGTISGQTRLTPIGSGLIAVAAESYNDEEGSPFPILDEEAELNTAFNVHYQGERSEADLITLP